MAFDAITGGAGASTSSSKEPCYDVFINHHGKDVKLTLASTIYHMLNMMGAQAFLDQDELELGDSFPRAIEDAMRSASVHIAIFSPRYAESPWCLEELSLMLRLKDQFEVTIIPVFYGVDPSDLRHVAKGKGKYADAFLQHQRKRRYDPKKIREWKESLSRGSYLTGQILDADKCDQGKLLSEIVETALHNMKKKPLEVAQFPVGLDEIVQDFECEVGSSTQNENVHIVGIVGMGGSGKTTLAKELYNRRSSYIRGGSSFISNIRDAASKNALPNLQKNLFSDLHIQPPAFHNNDQGKGMLDRSLLSKTVLIVLDDVDHVDQLHALLPPKHNLGPGSFIIVTTREVHVLTAWGISSIYTMKPLRSLYANQLFLRHAFLQPYSQLGIQNSIENSNNFKDLIERFVKACKGLPLSLKVFGAMVNGQSKAYWESQLQRISRILPSEIVGCLKISYDALDSETQQMFLDIACFFIGEAKKSHAVETWNGSGWSGEVGWETLVNKCLVGLDKNGYVEMHDHLRDLGRKIAEQKSGSGIWEAGSSARIWNKEQINTVRGGTLIRGIVGTQQLCPCF